MGTELDSVDRKGDADRIWIDFVRLLAGRIGDLELTPEGEPAKAGVHVRPAGLHRKTYVPILLELDTRWHVRPFPFDWREDIDKSAARLDAEITAFGAGEPVHLVAHSMGGLVSRRFAQRHAATWKAMDDATGAGRGGRLVMLGTPNRGSFAIPLTLSGAEKLLKVLAKGDIHHSMKQLLEIVSTFPGLYQMLPSPLVDLGPDETTRSCSTSPAGERLPAKAPLLARADAFHARPRRGDRPAPAPLRRRLQPRDARAGSASSPPASSRIARRSTATGACRTSSACSRASRRTGSTRRTATSRRTAHVLDAITELLQTGKTTVLATTKPAKPTRARGRRATGSRGDAVAPLPVEARVIAEKAKVQRRSTGEPRLTPEEQERLRNLTLAEYLGSGEDAGRGRARRGRGGGLAVEGSRARRRRDGAASGCAEPRDRDRGRLGRRHEGRRRRLCGRPLRGRRAAVRGARARRGGLRRRGRKEYEPRRLVITQHAARGSLHADLGDVSFFPWGDARHANRVVAVAGMGRPGTFDGTGLRRLVGELIVAVTRAAARADASAPCSSARARGRCRSRRL